MLFMSYKMLHHDARNALVNYFINNQRTNIYIFRKMDYHSWWSRMNSFEVEGEKWNQFFQQEQSGQKEQMIGTSKLCRVNLDDFDPSALSDSNGIYLVVLTRTNWMYSYAFKSTNSWYWRVGRGANALYSLFPRSPFPICISSRASAPRIIWTPCSTSMSY